MNPFLDIDALCPNLQRTGVSALSSIRTMIRKLCQIIG